MALPKQKNLFQTQKFVSMGLSKQMDTLRKKEDKKKQKSIFKRLQKEQRRK